MVVAIPAEMRTGYILDTGLQLCRCASLLISHLGHLFPEMSVLLLINFLTSVIYLRLCIIPNALTNFHAWTSETFCYSVDAHFHNADRTSYDLRRAHDAYSALNVSIYRVILLLWKCIYCTFLALFRLFPSVTKSFGRILIFFRRIRLLSSGL